MTCLVCWALDNLAWLIAKFIGPALIRRSEFTSRAVRCLARAEKSCLVSGYRASCFVDIYSYDITNEPSTVPPVNNPQHTRIYHSVRLDVTGADLL